MPTGVQGLVRRSRRPSKELELGRPILLQSSVEVQVLPGQVGEHRHVKLAASHPIYSQSVRAHLQHGGLRTHCYGIR